MTNPDYRALCAELVDEAIYLGSLSYEQDPGPDLIARARAALAQPKPVAPTVMEIIELHSWLDDEWQANNDGEDLPALDFARAVLAKWGTPAAPWSNSMTNPDFRALCAELENAYSWCIEEYMTAPAGDDTLIQRARAALAQPVTPANALEQPNDN